MQKHKRAVSETTKKHVAARQSWRCNICQNMLTAFYDVDHIQALWRGGSNDDSNLQALCKECHAQKGHEERIAQRLKEMDSARMNDVQRFFSKNETGYIPYSFFVFIMTEYGFWQRADVDRIMVHLQLSKSLSVMQFPLIFWSPYFMASNFQEACERDVFVKGLSPRAVETFVHARCMKTQQEKVAAHNRQKRNSRTTQLQQSTRSTQASDAAVMMAGVALNLWENFRRVPPEKT